MIRGAEGLWKEKFNAIVFPCFYFAETFMLFMKHRGKIPAKFAKKPAIRKEWKAVPKSCGVSRRGRGRKIAGIGASLVYYSAIRQTPC